MDAPNAGSIGRTDGRSPMACAAALAVIEVIEEENLLERANQIGQRICDRFLDMAENGAPCIDNVRTAGAMVACGTFANTIRILLPLTAVVLLMGDPHRAC